ncbi:MAG: helix-turn-helix transcriptional regulator [Gammaproteobacteria bacterium]|nr:helix-turn-helix transcriptional regulator [Gammaproteobacteria bacterium]
MNAPYFENPLQQLPESNGPITRSGVGALLVTKIHQQQVIRRITFFEPSVCLLLDGRKTFHCDGLDTHFQNGHLMAVAAGFSTDVVAQPCAEQRICRTLQLTISQNTITEFVKTHALSALASTAISRFKMIAIDPALADNLRFTLRGIHDETHVSAAEAQHRLFGLLLALAERGVVFREPSAQTVAEQVRLYVATSPSTPWTAAIIADKLDMSEATLRRRLQAEQCRFQDIVVDIRLHHGLALLMTTQQPITQISLACGYDSASRFSERFRARFGTLPSQIRE